MNTPSGRYRLVDATDRTVLSSVPGEFGGHRRSRIYGRLDCATARRALARGGYARSRVFFADEPTAVAAGFRPCAVCLPDRYRAWKEHRTWKEKGVADSPLPPT